MSRILTLATLVAVGIAVLAVNEVSLGQAQAAHKWGLKEGTPELKSAGHLAFGPDAILFVGDAKGAAIFAIDTGDTQEGSAAAPRNIEKLNEKLAAALKADQVVVNDLAVNPISGSIYLSVSVGEEAAPALAKIDAAGQISPVSLAKVPFASVTLPNPPEDKITGEGPRARNRRLEAITDMAFVEGKVLVAGLTSDAAPSYVREIAFPFAALDAGLRVEIYHGAHGRLEDNAAIRTFVPFTIDGEPSLLAGFTCTPLVRFSIDGAKPGEAVRGTTVAELGNRNMPLDMVVYQKDGQPFLLMANTARGVMKISTQDIGRAEGITQPVGGGGTAGQKFEQVEDLAGTVQLDKLNDEQAVVIIQKDGTLALKTIELP